MPFQKYFRSAHQFLSQVRSLWLVLSSLIFLTLLTYLDYITGTEYGFTLFYLFSVLLLTWFINLGAGVIVSFLSILSWFGIRVLLLSGKSMGDVNFLILSGEAAFRLVFLLVCCYVLSLLQKDMAIRDEQTKELIELNKMKNFFIGMVAHDLRNPLSVIEMSAFTLRDDENRKNLSQDQLMLLESIYRKSVYMLKLIEEYLDVMKIEAGRLELNKSTYDYVKFIADIVALNTIIAHQKNISIAIHRETDIPMFSFDRNKISQVLSNLLINAINYSQPHSTVKITLKVDKEYIVTEIVDNGPGIQAQDMNRLFEAFYRSKGTTEKGTGLGLTISKKIIEAHGGTIGFRNNSDAGSTFWFTLPETVLNELQIGPALV